MKISRAEHQRPLSEAERVYEDRFLENFKVVI